VLAAHILGLTTEHGQRKTFLDKFVAVDRWRNRLEDLLGDAWLARQLTNSRLIFISKFNH
jgi:hypothetical protein